MAGQFLPVALDVRGRRCVIVGGGAVGARKANAFCEAGAEVIVVAPEVSATIAEAVASGIVMHLAELFAPSHLDNAFIAVAATDNPEVNALVAWAARERGILLNLAAPTTVEENGELEGGDFVTMATVRRGDLLVGITTGGAGPALAARLRRDLEAQFGPEWVEFTKLLGDMRRTVKTRIPDAGRRTTLLRKLAERDDLRLMLANGDHTGVEREVAACLL